MSSAGPHLKNAVLNQSVKSLGAFRHLFFNITLKRKVCKRVPQNVGTRAFASAPLLHNSGKLTFKTLPFFGKHLGPNAFFDLIGTGAVFLKENDVIKIKNDGGNTHTFKS